MTIISLIRHGLVNNPEQKYYGRLPGFPLAEEGQRQAAAAGAYLAGRPIAVIYHGPLLRAFQTADIVRAHCGAMPPLAECRLLNEIHSAYDGLSIEEMESRDWNFYREVVPPYEEPQDVLARLVEFFEQARQKHPGEHVIGVSHADPIAFAILWASDLPLSAEQRKRLRECGIDDSYPAPASISTFTFSDGEAGGLTGLQYHAPTGGPQ